MTDPTDPSHADRPRLLGLDHVSFTVADLDAAIAFYTEAFGAEELFRMGPLDAVEMPLMPDGRDWMAAHVGVGGACLTLAMLKLSADAKLQLVQYDKPADRDNAQPRVCDLGGHHLGLRVDDVDKAARYLKAMGCTVMEIIAIDAGPLAGKKNLYVRDPFGNPLELVD